MTRREMTIGEAETIRRLEAENAVLRAEVSALRERYRFWLLACAEADMRPACTCDGGYGLGERGA